MPLNLAYAFINFCRFEMNAYKNLLKKWGFFASFVLIQNDANSIRKVRKKNMRKRGTLQSVINN